MTQLNVYFNDRQSVYNALERYLQLVDQRGWDIDGRLGKLHLYSLASHAFDSTTPPSEALKAFRQVYETVQNWPGVKRGGSFATAQDVFYVLLRGGSQFFSVAGISLANITYPSSQASSLKTFLPSLKFVKSTKQYPWMAVSKVLHFTNPGLFPMWDWEVIWGKVMGKDQSNKPAAFHNEYKIFCRERGFSVWENRPEFVLYYTLWAASNIQQRSPEFMDWFVDWMNHLFAEDVTQYGLGQKLAGYFATAFEFVIIGAAHLEMNE